MQQHATAATAGALVLVESKEFVMVLLAIMINRCGGSGSGGTHHQHASYHTVRLAGAGVVPAMADTSYTME